MWDNINTTDYSISSDKSKKKFLSACSANQTIEKITLYPGRNNWRFMDAVLLELGKGLGTRTLRELCVEGDSSAREAHWVVLAQF